MADKKRKSRDGESKQLQRREKTGKKRFTKHRSNKSGAGGGAGGGSGGGRMRTKSSGPRLPSAFRKRLGNFGNPNSRDDDDDNDENIDSDEAELNYGNDVYEYEEEVAEEESKKNKRYDHVDNYEYELPEKFQDEDINSEDEDEDGADHGEDDEDYSEEDDDRGRHTRMLQEITGMPAEAFEGKKKRQNAVVSEAYPESEFNPSRDVLSGNGQISIEDLLDPLRGTSDYGKLRKRIRHVEKKETPIQAPLHKQARERVERAVAYNYTKKDITKWEPLVKRNREAPTIYFDKTVDIGFSTVGAIASEFKPRTDFEKSIASLVQDNEVVDAYKGDGAKLLELNKLSVEEVKERQNRLAKMRSLLFRHEMKAKHIKKIKSKTYHRLKKKDRMKAAALELTDPEAAKEFAEKKERERAEARMTLRHKNQGKWAKRILERGLDKQDEGTRAAISEQLHMHNLLTRKMNSMKDSSSSDDSSYEDDDGFDSEDEDGAAKLLEKAKEKTMKLMDQEDEVPDSGVLSLPFMVRGLEKRKEAANEEAKRALEDYESSLKQRDKNADKGQKDGMSSGRRVFGAPRKQVDEANVKQQRPDVDNYGSDSEDPIKENDDADTGNIRSQKDVNIDLDVLREGLETDQDSVFKNIEEEVDNPGPRTTYEVSVFASGSWKKMKSKDKVDPSLDAAAKKGKDKVDAGAKNKPSAAEPSDNNHVGEEEDEDSDTDSGGQMIDGILSSGTKHTYELPTNEELVRRAFAGDDVEMEFEKAKEHVLNEENPEPEKPLVLPGWGDWTHVQKKRGTPSWMLQDYANAEQKRDEALKKRKDARLKHVIISEKVDKKAEKLHAKTLPYPFTSKEVYEQSMRMPIGPESNPTTTARALIRPEVVKKAGVIIDPIKFEEVDPHEKGEDQKKGGRKRGGKNKASSKKTKK